MSTVSMRVISSSRQTAGTVVQHLRACPAELRSVDHVHVSAIPDQSGVADEFRTALHSSTRVGRWLRSLRSLVCPVW